MINVQRITWRLLLALGLCTLAFACGASSPTSPTSSATPPPLGPFTLTGHVIASDTGAPLPGANIYILFGENKGGYTKSDKQGIFKLSELKPGTFTIEVVPQQIYNVDKRELVLTSDLSLIFALTPRVPVVYALSGRVTDITSGLPIAGASITILDGPNASRTSTSDSNGAFQLADVIYGGFTARVGYAGYDSEFRSLIFVGDTSIDIQMRPAMQSLAGTWTGTISRAPDNSGFSIPELRVTHAGAAVSVAYPNSVVLFSGTLRDPSSITSTTQMSGTIKQSIVQGPPRAPTTCNGTGNFTGTANWTRIVITAPQVIFECGVVHTNVTVSLVRQQ